jgi:hypothetical protein
LWTCLVYQTGDGGKKKSGSRRQGGEEKNVGKNNNINTIIIKINLFRFNYFSIAP